MLCERDKAALHKSQIMMKAFVYSILLFLGKCFFYNRKSKVLYYHDVHQDGTIPKTDMSTPLSLFKKHLKIIKESGFEVVPEIKAAKNQIMITFDDGYLGVFENRFFFKENELMPTVFIITDEVAKPMFMSSNEILLLKEIGFKFQSHTHTHPDLNLCNSTKLEEEFNESKTKLTAIVKDEVDSICFPKGFFNKKTVAMAYKLGYKRLYSSIPGDYSEANKFNVIYRNLVQFSSPFDLKCILFGGLNLFKNRYTKQHYYE